MAGEIGLGTRIGEYRVTGLIAEGGMATVYLAEHEGSDRRVALKVLSPELGAKSEFRERFLRESRYASELDHAHIVKVRDVGESDGLLYLAMDFVHGMDLTTLLALEGPLAPERALAIVEPIAQALDAVHATGLVHRDIKPGNVIIAEEAGTAPRPFLTDFGLSKNPSANERKLTAAGEFVGTYHYTAPEQILGRTPDHRVDVYSLGCLLYECLTERPPFHGRDEAEVLHAHLEAPAPALSEVRPDLPSALDGVVAKAMAKRADERYESCAELVAAFREAAGLRPAESPAAPDATPQAPTPERLAVRVTAGPAQGREIVLGDVLEFGRQASGDANLAGDEELSRRHARVFRTPDGWMVEDLGSSNGTFLNGRRVAHPHRLMPGDRLQLGATTLVAIASDPPPQDAGDPPPAIAVQVRYTPGSREAWIELDGEGERVRAVYEDGRWRFSARA